MLRLVGQQSCRQRSCTAWLSGNNSKPRSMRESLKAALHGSTFMIMNRTSRVPNLHAPPRIPRRPLRPRHSVAKMKRCPMTRYRRLNARSTRSHRSKWKSYTHGLNSVTRSLLTRSLRPTLMPGASTTASIAPLPTTGPETPARSEAGPQSGPPDNSGFLGRLSLPARQHTPAGPQTVPLAEKESATPFSAIQKTRRPQRAGNLVSAGDSEISCLGRKTTQ